MANWILSECGIRPFAHSKLGLTTQKLRKTLVNSTIVRKTQLGHSQICSNSAFKRDWVLKVSALLKVVSVDDEEDFAGERSLGGGEFDPAARPPFDLAAIRAAIPKHCWVKNTWRSMSYVVRDVAVVLGLAVAAAHVNNWVVWPLYWAAQGTMFWALFVLGHDCGHGSFSNNPKLNSVVGHFLHSSILVPYHGW